MHYVLPYLYGDKGYSIKYYDSNGDIKVSCMSYYSYYLQIRDLNKITINNFGRLFQQYSVDMYSKVEMERLDYIKFNQNAIRAELYQGLEDLLNVNDTNETNNLENMGKKVILPSSFTGSPRQMHQLYQDSMAIVRRYGKPDLFITVTCNPYWPEIQNNLGPNGIYQNRPDIVTRVYNSKLKSIKHDLIHNKIFGATVSHLYVIEFQARGILCKY
jgi:hypothetical protein